MIQLPMFEPPPEAVPDLASYDCIVVNSSAGKDSQAMLDVVAAHARQLDILARVVVLHCDLGKSPGGHEIEWPGTKELAAEHAAHYGVRFEMVRRGVRGFLEEVEDRGAWPSQTERYCTSYFKRDQGSKVITKLAGEARGFLQQVEHRGMWPSNGQRFCTSKFKQEPGQTGITALANETRATAKRRPHILNCFGFRAQESPRRRKMQPFAENKRISNGAKRVDDWLPIHDWTVEQVWARIKAAGTRPHYAYSRGMTRLSCRFCIFAPKSQLMISARENPELFREYVELEARIGHTFRVKESLADVARAIEAGEAPTADDGAWNM